MAAAPPLLCLHCASPVPADLASDTLAVEGSAASGPFCCNGCREVYGLLRQEGFSRYYDLSGGRSAPVAQGSAARSSLAFVEPLVGQAEAAAGQWAQCDVDVQGLHCAACVWLLSELGARHGEGTARVQVNPALGRIRFVWKKGAFDLQKYLADAERFGYRFGPARRKQDAGSRELLVRLGVSAAITANVMTFAVAFHFGLAPADGENFRLFTHIVALLSGVVVVVGGWPFLRSAFRSLTRGILHLDLPIAMGILLAFGASYVQATRGRGDLAYFDTLNTFVTLMLFGRWLQERVLDKNRKLVLEDGGADGILVRRRRGAAVELVPAPKILAGDRLLVAPGDLVPVDGTLEDDEVLVSLDWITGEPAAVRIERGGELRAGSFVAGDRAVTFVARTSFLESPLPSLLRPAPAAPDQPTSGRLFWDRLARVWVVGVLSLASFALWLHWDRGPWAALDVAVALLVVTCPCAIGIATPLAYELAQAGLRRAGVFVRSAELLDRVPSIHKLLFDKTGTLTFGRPGLLEPTQLDPLTNAERDLVYEMAARSSHPASRALATALQRRGAQLSDGAHVREVPGQGLELTHGERTYRLGRPSFVVAGASDAHGVVAFGDRGLERARFDIDDLIRPDAARTIAALQEDGHEAWLLSGDEPSRVQHAAAQLGIPSARAIGGLSPEGKAQLVRGLDRRDTLFLGDGINDSLAFEAALASGTPAVDRPVLPGKADFYLLGDGVHGVQALLQTGARLQTVVRRVLALALAYNAIAVLTCLLGAMTPLRAAIAMPLSSVSLVVFAAASMTARNKSRPSPLEQTPREKPPTEVAA